MVTAHLSKIISVGFIIHRLLAFQWYQICPNNMNCTRKPYFVGLAYRPIMFWVLKPLSFLSVLFRLSVCYIMFSLYWLWNDVVKRQVNNREIHRKNDITIKCERTERVSSKILTFYSLKTDFFSLCKLKGARPVRPPLWIRHFDKARWFPFFSDRSVDMDLICHPVNVHFTWGERATSRRRRAAPGVAKRVWGPGVPPILRNDNID